MDEFYNAYAQDLTKLTDSNTENVENESVGKWFSNLFKNKSDVMNETIANVIEKFRFKPIEVNGDVNPDFLGKKQGPYYIAMLLNQAEKDTNILVSVFSKNGKEIGNASLIEMKHSWTDEELAATLQNAVKKFRIKLSSAGGSIPEEIGPTLLKALEEYTTTKTNPAPKENKEEKPQEKQPEQKEQNETINKELIKQAFDKLSYNAKTMLKRLKYKK